MRDLCYWQRMDSRATASIETFGFAVVGLAATGWLLYVGQGIIIPILFGALLAFLLESLARAAARLPLVGPFLPYPVRVGLSVIVTFLCLLFVVSLFVANMDQVVRDAPGYVDAFSTVASEAASQFGYEIVVTWKTVQRLFLSDLDLQALIRYGIGSLYSSAAYIALVFIYALFFLVEEKHLNRKLSVLFKTPEKETRARSMLSAIYVRVGAYITLKTGINILLGLVCWVILAVFGIYYASFWAILSGVLNYIPYVGSLIAVLLPVFVSVGQYGSLETSLALLVTLVLAQSAVAYFIEPRVLGKRLNLSPLVILISLAAWSGLWGVAGALLSVPLTAIIMIVFEAFDPTRSVAVLLSEAGAIGRDRAAEKSGNASAKPGGETGGSPGGDFGRHSGAG